MPTPAVFIAPRAVPKARYQTTPFGPGKVKGSASAARGRRADSRDKGTGHAVSLETAHTAKRQDKA